MPEREEGGKDFLFQIIVALLVAIIFIILADNLWGIGQTQFYDVMHSLLIRVRVLMIAVLSSPAGAFSGLSNTVSMTIFQLIHNDMGLSEPPPYTLSCSANTTEGIIDCLVDLSVDCWEKYGSGEEDTLMGTEAHTVNRDWFGVDEEFYDFSIPCGIVEIPGEVGPITTEDLENYYSHANITTGEPGFGINFTYSSLLGLSSLSQFIDFNADKHTDFSFNSRPLRVMVKYVDLPGNAKGQKGYYGYCGAFGFFNNLVEWFSESTIGFDLSTPCWHSMVEDCGQTYDDAPEAITEKDRVVWCYAKTFCTREGGACEKHTECCDPHQRLICGSENVCVNCTQPAGACSYDWECCRNYSASPPLTAICHEGACAQGRYPGARCGSSSDCLPDHSCCKSRFGIIFPNYVCMLYPLPLFSQCLAS